MIQLPNDILIPQVADMIKQGHTVTLPLKGYSMRPYLEDGRDKALLTAVTQDLKVGDVILAEIAPKRWALHRIVSMEGNDITMYGDGNFSAEHITHDDIIAIAVGFYRKGSDKIDSVDSTTYRLYWKSWVKLRPFRRYLLLAWNLSNHPSETIARIFNKIKNSL